MMTALPDELSQLQRLRVIKATHNRMAQLPPGLAQLTALRELHVAGNNMQVRLLLACFSVVAVVNAQTWSHVLLSGASSYINSR
jgi:hypothetical protein